MFPILKVDVAMTSTPNVLTTETSYTTNVLTTCVVIHFLSTIMILLFWTDMPGQTVQTKIRVLLEEQSVQGLHYLPFHLHRLDSLLYGRAT